MAGKHMIYGLIARDRGMALIGAIDKVYVLDKHDTMTVLKSVPSETEKEKSKIELLKGVMAF